ARPGGNVTGLSNEAGVSIFVKQIDYLRQMVKGLSRLASLVPESFYTPGDSDARTKFFKDLGIESRRYIVRELADLEPAFAMMKQDGMQAVLVVADGMIVANTARVAQLALTHRLPLSSHWQGFPPAGGLMSYDPDIADQYRRSAGYVDKIFRGANPAELPVERPTRFRFILNMKTAKVLGLTVPQAVLLVADEVID
ncbi:MAG: ABC transporter substrate-binding protein, partial [Burkholderiales bacterium]